MSDISRPTPEELSAFVDDELAADRQAEIAYLVSTDAELAIECARLQALTKGLQSISHQDNSFEMDPAVLTALDELKAGPAPPPPMAAPTRVSRTVLAAWGAAAIVMIALFLTPVITDRWGEDRRMAADLAYYLDSGQDSIEFGPDEEDKISRTLAGFDMASRDTEQLRMAGFVLAGGRLFAREGRGTILFFYLTPDNSLVGLLVSPEQSEASIASKSISGEVNTVQWREGKFAYAVSGRQSLAQLRSFETAFRSK